MNLATPSVFAECPSGANNFPTLNLGCADGVEGGDVPPIPDGRDTVMTRKEALCRQEQRRHPKKAPTEECSKLVGSGPTTNSGHQGNRGGISGGGRPIGDSKTQRK